MALKSINRFFYILLSLAVLQPIILIPEIPYKEILFVLIALVIVFWHGVEWMGWKRMMTFFAIVLVISWGYETLSVMTGFPFGDYYYTDKLGVKIGLIPVNIMPVYFAVGYFSYVLSNILFSKRYVSYPGWSALPVALGASFLMVSWDLTMDPMMATVKGNWIWADGGPYFGVPLSNFAGWYLCVFTFYFVFALLNRNAQPESQKASMVTNPKFWLPVIAAYFSLWVANVGRFFVVPNGEVFDPTGRMWMVGDVTGTQLLIASFTLLPISLYSAYRIITELKTQNS